MIPAQVILVYFASKLIIVYGTTIGVNRKKLVYVVWHYDGFCKQVCPMPPKG